MKQAMQTELLGLSKHCYYWSNLKVTRHSGESKTRLDKALKHRPHFPEVDFKGESLLNV